MIKENISAVEKSISNTVECAGINPDNVTLIAVSKTKPLEMLQEAYDYGIRDFGENKVQEILEKYDSMPSDVRWHMIGHLQTNKVKYIIDKVYMIHSVDSVKLAKEIDKHAIKAGIVMPVLIEVNVADEDSKFGISVTELESFLRELSALKGISVRGLMTVAPYTDNAEENRQYFSKMRQLSVDITQKNIDNISMNVLSMGMSGDYLVAIEEGASYVRVGTGIFGERYYIN